MVCYTWLCYLFKWLPLRGRLLPESGRPAGYAALIGHFNLNSTAVQTGITSAPLGRYTRRVWYLYEWLTGKRLNIPDLDGRPTAVDVLDTSQQVGLPKGKLSVRHRVRDNLPGTPTFCPTVRWTDTLRHAVLPGYQYAKELKVQIEAEVAELLRRAEASDAQDTKEELDLPKELELRKTRLAAIDKAIGDIEARAKAWRQGAARAGIWGLERGIRSTSPTRSPASCLPAEAALSKRTTRKPPLRWTVS